MSQVGIMSKIYISHTIDQLTWPEKAFKQSLTNKKLQAVPEKIMMHPERCFTSLLFQSELQKSYRNSKC